MCCVGCFNSLHCVGPSVCVVGLMDSRESCALSRKPISTISYAARSFCINLCYAMFLYDEMLVCVRATHNEKPNRQHVAYNQQPELPTAVNCWYLPSSPSSSPSATVSIFLNFLNKKGRLAYLFSKVKIIGATMIIASTL